MTAILNVESVRVSYGDLEVLKGISLSVAPGEGFAIIGPNGAGKTTLFKAMTGEVRITAGTVRFEGREITRLDRKSTRLNSSHVSESRMPSSA